MYRSIFTSIIGLFRREIHIPWLDSSRYFSANFKLAAREGRRVFSGHYPKNFIRLLRKI